MYSKYAEIRDKQGMKDIDVSKETGISPSTFSDWKAGRYEPKYEKKKIIADFLKVPIDSLLP